MWASLHTQRFGFSASFLGKKMQEVRMHEDPTPADPEAWDLTRSHHFFHALSCAVQ